MRFEPFIAYRVLAFIICSGIIAILFWMVFPELTVPRLLSALFQIVFALLSVKFISMEI